MSESAVQVLSFFAAEWSSDAITEVNWSFGDREDEKLNDDVPDSIDVFMSESAVQVLSDVADNDSEKSLDVATTVLDVAIRCSNYGLIGLRTNLKFNIFV